MTSLPLQVATLLLSLVPAVVHCIGQADMAPSTPSFFTKRKQDHAWKTRIQHRTPMQRRRQEERLLQSDLSREICEDIKLDIQDSSIGQDGSLGTRCTCEDITEQGVTDLECADACEYCNNEGTICGTTYFGEWIDGNGDTIAITDQFAYSTGRDETVEIWTTGCVPTVFGDLECDSCSVRVDGDECESCVLETCTGGFNAGFQFPSFSCTNIEAGAVYNVCDDSLVVPDGSVFEFLTTGGDEFGVCFEVTFPPTGSPTRQITTPPTPLPTNSPTTPLPSLSPSTSSPSVSPTTSTPSVSPSTSAPSVSPSTSAPSGSPTTSMPTMAPTTSSPTEVPTSRPSTPTPSMSPTASPSSAPTRLFSDEPTQSLSANPTTSPSSGPSLLPTGLPSASPSTFPPTPSPTTPMPSLSISPTTSPPTTSPSISPSSAPSTSLPSATPTTPLPSASPTTLSPTELPTTGKPTSQPPTPEPTPEPTAIELMPSMTPTGPLRLGTPVAQITVSPSSPPTNSTSNTQAFDDTPSAAPSVSTNPTANDVGGTFVDTSSVQSSAFGLGLGGATFTYTYLWTVIGGFILATI